MMITRVQLYALISIIKSAVFYVWIVCMFSMLFASLEYEKTLVLSLIKAQSGNDGAEGHSDSEEANAVLSSEMIIPLGQC